MTIVQLRDLRSSASSSASPSAAPSCSLVDVRSATEFAAGHVPGAINVPLEQLGARVQDLDTTRPIVLLCQSGQRARLAAERLRPLGAQLDVLEGGTAAWIAAGHPVVRSVSAGWSLERQVRLGAGLLVLAASLLALLVDPRWIGLAAFVGAGLTFAGLTNICPMGIVLGRMPWNRVRVQVCEPCGS